MADAYPVLKLISRRGWCDRCVRLAIIGCSNDRAVLKARTLLHSMSRGREKPSFFSSWSISLGENETLITSVALRTNWG